MLRTIARLLPTVLGAMVTSLAGLLVIRALVDADTLRGSNDVVGNYLQGMGAIYAVLLAFVVYAVWGQFNETRASVEREANEVVDLHRTASGLPPEVRARLHAALGRYVDAVLAQEWPALTRPGEAALAQVGARVGALLDDVWAELHAFEPGTACHTALHAEALTRFNDLSDARTMRLVTAQARIPQSLRLLLYVGAVSLIGSMYLLAVDELVVHALVTASIAGAVSHVLYVIEDLDDPFTGDWQVSAASFRRLRDHAGVLAPTPTPARNLGETPRGSGAAEGAPGT